MEKVVKTVCFHCPPACGIDVHTKDNKPVKVEGMMESIVGPICMKAEVIPEWYETALKDRLLHPLKRERFGWKEISYEEALNIIVERLQEIKDRYGPQALAFYGGQVAPNRDWDYLVKLFFDVYGSPSLYSAFSFCWTNRAPAAITTYGQYAVPTFHRTKCIVCWGGNPPDAIPFVGDAMLSMKRRGETKLIVVDPRRTLLAKEADIHAMIRPGTDPALGLGLLNVVISEGLWDKEFVEKWTVGFDKLCQHVKDWPPERVSEITWVKADTIRDFARIYATTKPATIFWGNSLDNMDNGFQAHRAIQILMSITCNLDSPGGSRFIPFVLFQKRPYDEEYPLNLVDIPQKRIYRMKPAGEDEYPLWLQVGGEAQTCCMVDAILTGRPYPIKAMIIEAGNPVITWADTVRFKKALDKLEFLVVIDTLMTETAELADIVLPAPTFLEQQQIYHYVGRPMYVLLSKAIEPPANCWPDMKLWLELAKRMGYEAHFPWNSIDEVQNHLLKKVGLTLDDLRRNPEGVFYAKSEWKKYEKEGFRTPSGKVEIYSQRVKDLGGDPLPTYREPAESPISQPHLARKFPLILITGARQIEYNHSMLRNVPSLRKRVPEAKVDIHPDTAKKLGISEGEMVIIESPRGYIEMRAALSEDIHPEVISIPHAWGRMANQNILTSSEIRDPLTGAPAMRALLCRVLKATQPG